MDGVTVFGSRTLGYNKQSDYGFFSGPLDEWKFNERSDGSMYSLYTFSRKTGSTIVSGLQTSDTYQLSCQEFEDIFGLVYQSASIGYYFGDKKATFYNGRNVTFMTMRGQVHRKSLNSSK